MTSHLFTTSDLFWLFPRLGHSLCSMHVSDRVHLLVGPDCSGATPADSPSHRLVPSCWTLILGCWTNLAGGLLHLSALSLIQYPH